MGYAERLNPLIHTRLAGARIVVDVQHLYRDGKHAGDRGAIFQLEGGATIAEAQATVVYAQALTEWLRSRGAQVLTNDPVHGILVGPYSKRTAAANAYQAHAFIACHVNAGGGAYALAEYQLAGLGQAMGDMIGAKLVERFPEIRAHKCDPIMPGARGDVCVDGVSWDVPALILEPFFGDTRRMQALFAHDRLVALGEAIGEGVAVWWSQQAKK